ncbi:mechanosensitive ion channel family protein [Pseudohoeflea sp. DP4N28-3]|uniref:Small-conductance mechanosensitive channel n=2 Tax=Pseudohoeflea coraliihabitans TaxID=2860393 RepID=A0ABS6WRG4_9HYPH|nr:mechanosensitive ion channel family protein [Pseudohoeflea sp. DP4N28-3]
MAQVNAIARGTIALLPQLAVAIVVLVVTALFVALASRLAARMLARTRLRPSLQSLFVTLISIGLWALGISIALVIVFPTLTPAGILAGLGLGSVAIGFAFKDIFENFLAGIIILFRKEMRIGDFIECEGLEGKVEAIAIRESHIRQTDGQLVIVPNSVLFKNPLTIRTDLDQRRTTVICGVAYDEDVDQAREVITKAVKSCDTVISDARPVQVFAQEFADSSINFEVTWWTGSKPVDLRRSRDQVVAAVKRALDEAGIEIPFPYRTLTFKEPLALNRAGASDTADDS